VAARREPHRVEELVDVGRLSDHAVGAGAAREIIEVDVIAGGVEDDPGAPGSARSAAQSATPSSVPKRRSSTITSGRARASAARISSPSPAVPTQLNPGSDRRTASSPALRTG